MSSILARGLEGLWPVGGDGDTLVEVICGKSGKNIRNLG